MRKQELIHLHALCLRLRDRLDEQLPLDPAWFARYDALDVDPTAVHRRKADHHRAVLTLLDGLTTALRATDETAADSPDTSRLVERRED